MSASLRWNEIKAGTTVYFYEQKSDGPVIRKAMVVKGARKARQGLIGLSMNLEPASATMFLNNFHVMPYTGKDTDMSVPSKHYYRTKAKLEAAKMTGLSEAEQRAAFVADAFFSVAKKLEGCPPLSLKHTIAGLCEQYGITTEEYFGEQIRRGTEVRRQGYTDGIRQFHVASRRIDGSDYFKNRKEFLDNLPATMEAPLAKPQSVGENAITEIIPGHLQSIHDELKK